MAAPSRRRNVPDDMTLETTKHEPDKAMLVAVRSPRQGQDETEELLGELRELAITCGAKVVAQRIVRMQKPQAHCYIGRGNVESIAAQCAENGANLVVLDDILSPSQQRNWEHICGIQVIDRQELILRIFGARASTREAELQIELATAEYALPRLKRAWTHLSRQRGGVGLRGGEGEKQIEVDARLVRRRIAKLKDELKAVRRRRAEQRKKRRQVPVPTAAIVGYTNAGKSSLLNHLTNARVTVEDKLFATLDPTTRRLRLPNNQDVLLTDTVGFVRKLPHDLVEAFKATLEEAVLANFLIHVIDVNSPGAEEHIATTNRVLAEIGAGDQEAIEVFNKTDLVEDPNNLRRLRRKHPSAIFMSAQTGDGATDLVEAMTRIVDRQLTAMDLRIPQDKYELVAALHRTCHVISETYEDDAVYVTASVPASRQADLQPYLVSA